VNARKTIAAIALLLTGCRSDGTASNAPAIHTPAIHAPSIHTPAIIVLGIAQDGGVPQAGRFDDPRWDNPAQGRMVACLGIVDPRTGKRWMIDATPDFRRQLTDLARASAGPARPAAHGCISPRQRTVGSTGALREY
jgi:hypothetical protein